MSTPAVTAPEYRTQPSASTAYRPLTDEECAEIVFSAEVKELFFERQASAIAIGKGINGFYREELEVYDAQQAAKAQGKKVSAAAYLLTGPPPAKAEAFVRDMAYHLLNGKNMVEIAPRYPGVFDPFLLSMLQVGSETADFEEQIKKYCQMLKEARVMWQAFFTAMIYPATVIVAAVVVVAVFMLFVVPGFKDLYAGLAPGHDFPWPTQVVLALSDFSYRYWWLVFLSGGGGFFLYSWARGAYPEVKQREQQLWMKIPVLNSLISQIDIHNYLVTLISLLESGVSKPQSAMLAASTISNHVLRTAALNAAARIPEQAEYLYLALAESHELFGACSSFYPEFKSYETSGNLEPLKKYAALLKAKADETRKRMEKLIEPISLAVLGGLVLFLLIALYMPMFYIVGILSK